MIINMKTVQCGSLSLGCLPPLFDQEQGCEGHKAVMLQHPKYRRRSCCSSHSVFLNHITCRNGISCGNEGFKIFMKPEERMGWLSFSSFSGSRVMLGSLQIKHGGSESFGFVGYVFNSISKLGECSFSAAGTDIHYSPLKKKSSRGRKFTISSAKFQNGEQSNASAIQDLPLFIPGGIIVDDWGTIYQGDGKEKYYNRKSASRHPYPVGYASKKVYKGSIFEQTIQAGPDGPIFVVKIGETCFTANTVNGVWAFASEHFQPGSKHRIHAHRHYGFESEDVLKRLRRMQEEHAQENISQNHTPLSSKTLEQSTEQVVPRQKRTKFETLKEHRKATESNRTLVTKERNPSTASTHVKQIQISEELLESEDTPSNGGLNKICKDSKKQAETLLPNDDLFKKMVRLRSKLLTDSYSKKENIVDLRNDFTSFIRPQHGKSISASSQADSEVNSLTSYSEDSYSDAPKLITTHKQFQSDLGSSRHHLKDILLKETLSENNMDEVDDVDDTSIGSKESDAAPSRLRISKLWGGSLLESSTKNSQCSSALNELLSYWRKTDMLTGETVLSMDSGTSVHPASDTVEIDKESQNPQETSYLNEASIFEKIRELFSNKKVEEAISFFKRHETGMPSLLALSENLFPFRLDDWQTRALQHLNEGDSVLLCAPHGAGKSVVAECCLYESILQDKRAIFVTPFAGLAHQQFLTFQKIFGESRVGGAWEATKVQLCAQILIVTLEFFVKELREHFDVEMEKKTTFLEGLNIIIMDKYFEAVDNGLGSLWEEAMMLMHSEVRLLALTLPATNADHLVSWLSHILKPCKLVQCESDPVPKNYFFFDANGLHELPSVKLCVVNGSLEPSSPNNGASYTDPELGSIAVTLQERSMLPAVIFCDHSEECIAATKDVLKVISKGFSSKGESEIIEKQLNMLLETTPEYLPLIEEYREGLRHGIVAHHDLQNPFWKQFVDALIHDDLVQLVLTTPSFFFRLGKRFRTAVVTFKHNTIQHRGHFIRKLSWQQGLVGRRGIDERGNVVFLSTQANDIDTMELVSLSWTEFSSYFKPSYSLLVNLLAKCDYVKVKEIIEHNFSRFVAKSMATKDKEEYAWIEKEETRCYLLLKECEKKLLKELKKENQQKLERAAVFTRVDVRPKKESNCLYPGVMFAIVPGPHERLYMVLCADNKFRLIPAGALERIYLEEPPLDLASQMTTGSTLKQPSLPSRRSWLPDPTIYASYVANGTPESAQLVEVLHHCPIKPHGKAEKECTTQTTMKSIEENLSNLRKRKELLSKRSSTIKFEEMREGKIWEEAQNKISVLDKAGALSQHKSANKMKLNSLATLISGLHYLKNELWVSMVLTSSFIKPLTPPELASICSTLVFEAENLDKLSKDKFKLSYKVPKRVQETLGKMEALREHVANMEGSPTHSLTFDVTPAALVHAWTRGKAWTHNSKFNSVNDDTTASILQSTVRLLQQIDMTCTESTKTRDVDSLLGLARISRRAAYLLNRFNKPLEDSFGKVL